jgi:hypothetical protein
MPAIRVQPLSIQAFRALAALEAYEARVEWWLAGPPERVASGMHVHLQRLRRCCGGCASLTVPWLALMICHFELLALLESPGATGKRLAQLAARHRLCVRELALACRHHLVHRQRLVTTGSAARERRAIRVG